MVHLNMIGEEDRSITGPSNFCLQVTQVTFTGILLLRYRAVLAALLIMCELLLFDKKKVF